MKIDETKLTAYALDELLLDERETMEADLRDDANAREQIEDIRATAQRIESALQTESDFESDRGLPPTATIGVTPFRVAVGPQAHVLRSRTAWRLAAAASLAVVVGTGAIVITS